MKKCPFCEGDVSETAKKCKHCGEWIKENVSDSSDYIDMDNNKPQLNKGGKKTGSDTGKSQSKIQKFLSDYGILLIIGIIIFYFGRLKPHNSKSNNLGTDNYEVETDDNIESEYTLAKGSRNGITPIKHGYAILSNKIGECNIQGNEEIESFILEVIKAGSGDTINWTCPNQNYDIVDPKYQQNVAFLFDNSYSENQNGIIDKKGPDERMLTMGNYLTNKRFPNGTVLDFVFMYTLKPDDNSEEPDGNLYRFVIDTSAFDIVYVKEVIGGENVFYDDKRTNLGFKNVRLSTYISGGNQSKCIEKNNYDYVCYDADSVYKKIQDIYSKEYDKDEKHTNNMFMKTLVMNNDRFFGGKMDDIYIFTNGEFKIGYEREKMYLSDLKTKYKKLWNHDAGADKTHNLTDFNMRYANWYQKDSKYESFWSDAIDELRPHLPICEGIKIHVIGLIRSAEFKPLAEKIYSKIFEPCEVLFQ